MDFYFSLLFFAIAISIIATSSCQKVNFKLDFAHTLCRHGDRTIRGQGFPNDRWGSPKYWPEGFQQLTNVGKRQHYALGQYLRNRFAKLLGNGDYNVDKIYVHSTDTDRTLMSAEACLASLFPPQGNQVWNRYLNWQPVPVHTEPAKDATVLPPIWASGKKCDRYDYEALKIKNSSAYKSMFVKNSVLIKNLERLAGTQYNTSFGLHDLYDALFVEQLKGLSIPPWAQQIMQPGSTFEQLALIWGPLGTETTAMKKIKSGFLLKEILDRSKNKTTSTLSPNRSLWMYFAHDDTITNMLHSLGLYKGLFIPPYASCLFFELYTSSDSTDNYLQLFYRNSTTDLQAFEIPGCGPHCPLEKWYALYKDILPTKSFEEECRLPNGVSLPPNENPEL